MNNNQTQYIFGPIPSRRLGRSLGVDVVPFKTCSYDCVYCHLGRTKQTIIEPNEWVPKDIVLDQLKIKLNSNPDYITLSGSGEPTLYSKIGELIDDIKTISSIPVAVLTNGSLLWKKEIRDQLINADLVVPSLDAGDELMFRHINRPHPDISFQTMLDGIIMFRQEFHNPLWLEVFLLSGFNSLQTDLQKLKRAVDDIKPDHIQLNTVTRPPAEEFAAAVSREYLSKVANIFSPPAQLINDYKGNINKSDRDLPEQEILTILQRRPCTAQDISNSLGISINYVLKCFEHLLNNNQIETRSINKRIYYVTPQQNHIR